MKQIILAAMVMMTVAGSASAETNAWDQFWGTDVPMAFKVAGVALDPANSGWNEFFGTTLNPENSGWNEFFGTTLNPENSGWNEFWYQCQDEDKTIGDCVGTIAAGIGGVVAIPVVAALAVAGVTVVLSSAATTGVVSAGTVWAAASPIGITASGTWIF